MDSFEERMMGRLAREKVVMDKLGIAIKQDDCHGFEISYNPDDGRFYVHDWNEYGDLETRATFQGNLKGFYNARQYAKTHEPRFPKDS